MKTITREGIKRIIGPVSGSGGSKGAGGGDISLAGLASEAWVEENYISKAFFNRLFTIHSASGVIDPNDPDEEQTIDSIEALVGFWTEQYVSALGQNSGGGGGGGGGGVTLNQPLEAINNAGLSAPTTAGTMLVWYNGGWTYSPGARLQIGGITATGTVLVNSSVTANSFIKTGGTSSMFLKADGSVDTNTYASETWVSQHYISIQFFETLFNAINAQGVKVNANSITGINSIKAMFGFWTEQYISALGQNSGGGGGGGVTLNQPLSAINTAGLSSPTTSGTLLVFNGTTWTYSTAATIVAATATFYGNSHAAGYAVTGKDNTYVVLAGGGTKLLSELGGNTSVSYNGSVYSPSSGIVALGYLTTSVKVNASTYSVNSSGLVDIGSVVTAVKIAGTQTPYSPTAGVVEIPAYPTIPTNVSAFTNDAGYVSTSVSLSDPHLVLASPSGSGGPASFRALVASDIPDLSSIYATSDTWRTVQCNGVSIGNNTLNLVAGTNVAISASNGTLTFSSTDTNTLNTAGAVQLGSTKLYLVGASSQTDGVQTYSNVNCYIGTDGCLYSAGSKVMTAASGYLPTTGGTMTGEIRFNYVSGVFNQRYYVGNTLKGAIGYWEPLHIMYFDNRVSGRQMRIFDNGTITFTDISNSGGTGDVDLITITTTGNIKMGDIPKNASAALIGCWINDDSKQGFAYLNKNEMLADYAKTTQLNNFATGISMAGTVYSAVSTIIPLPAIPKGNLANENAGTITWGACSSANGYSTAMQWFTPAPSGSNYGGYAFAYKGSEAYLQIDGFFYQNEGNYRVIDESGGTIANLSISYTNSYVNQNTNNYNLYVNVGSGTPYVSKQWSVTSDIRKKDIVNYIELNLGVIAQAPIFNFTWKEYPSTRPSVGTIAQYWEKVLPYSVSEGPDGYLAMDYGATALAAAVLTARKVSEHEQRIAELERENKVLWNMIATLKAS